MARRPTALLTGATSGIGLALTRRLSPTHDLVLCGRRERQACPLEMPGDAIYVQADLREPQAAVDAIETALATVDGAALDRLIVNAGIGYYRPAVAETDVLIRETMDVNLVAPVLLARRLAPQIEKARGKLVLIGSVAHRGSANMPAYAASKAGLAGLARSLESEWRGRIEVQVIHPGPTVTGMHERAGYDPGRLKPLFFPADGMAAEIDRLMRTRKPSVTIGAGSRLRRLLTRRAT